MSVESTAPTVGILCSSSNNLNSSVIKKIEIHGEICREVVHSDKLRYYWALLKRVRERFWGEGFVPRWVTKIWCCVSPNGKTSAHVVCLGSVLTVGPESLVTYSGVTTHTPVSSCRLLMRNSLLQSPELAEN